MTLTCQELNDLNISHYEIASCISAAWMRWRSTNDVLYDLRINERRRSKINRSIVRSVTLYGSECLPIMKDHKLRRVVMRRKMLRCSGVTPLDHIRSKDIRERYGIVSIVKKLRVRHPRSSETYRSNIESFMIA